MGKLRVLSGREVCDIPRAHGFVEVRRRGSHAVMQNRQARPTITVPVPDHRVVRRGTLAAIIRQSDLPHRLLEE